jgi:aminoglycoside phosphotransferase (APT) family kinase protein
LVTEDGELTAVLDWETSALGDAALDIAVQCHLGAEATESLLRRYRFRGDLVDASFRHRMSRYWAFREFGGISWAIEMSDRRELQDALAKLRASPVLTPASEGND